MQKITLFILALSFGLFSSLSMGASNKTSGQSYRLKAISYNTWMIPFLRKDPKQRANIIGVGIKSQNYGMVFMQEMFSSRYRKIVRKHFNDGHGFLGFRLPAIINSGLTTLSRYPVVKTGFLRFRACGGWQCLSRKGVQYTRIEIAPGVEVDAYNTHLQPYQNSFMLRRVQLAEMRAFMERTSSENRPTILAGDFNIIGESGEYAHLKSSFYDFVDVWASVKPGEPGYTWDPGVNRYAKPDYGEQFVNQRLDYLFVRDAKGWKWDVESVGLDFTSPFPFRGKEYFGSDHFAVGAYLRLSEAP